MFKLEVMSAKHGDALLLHYGTAAKPRRILIDAGPAGVYRAVVRPRLQALGAAPVALRMVMVSHVDADHITGVVDLFKDLRAAAAAGDPAPYDIATLWHNSFPDGLNASGVIASAEAPSGVSLAALGGGAKPPGVPLHADVLADLASVAQGAQLRRDALALGIGDNDPFTGLVMAPASGSKKVTIGDGLTFTVVGPNAKRLADLKKDWAKKTAKKKPSTAALAAYLDASIYNLSSIVVLAKSGAKTMLLTGDARGDDILASLAAAKLLKGGKLHVGLLKVPHHGSDRNVEPEFFEKVTADHYVFSADGKYGNPDVDTLKMLTAARGKAAYTMWFTNKVARCATFLAKDQKKGRKYRVEYRGKNDASVEVTP